ncbi:DNA polymerase III subunit alpha [Deinococcus soli (ex Cha et al. 2016)]|uniref:DNA-directed DNA polymerase n=2 Tax=Deinococcus soli (ex Cha et al. 2016) TaxID=1309411 RepID=A0AAE3XCY2_9DEIO|nr:DNA polymerase III subunit alpha [Deinococcus soli (ex Cha et al. 2016)]MDR6218207.1 DNA polymerase-3 subunit alpha [Deinococcus soli (ex Cha et al. 2016)]MDR6328947.1 DNA polymerase-3 subunit alpha [Deinococcus soli (ex Cha et al. 2016)]MDR6751220.1 DNA polymerase-3 subunit alpha [Deinococcus soli (ex Cha et al. 2016)]
MTHIHLPDGSCCAPKRFAHLHQHTQYSLLDGAAKVDDLLSWVKQVTPDRPTCALTDHGNMHGAVRFYNAALRAGVKPILGFEAYVTPGSRFDRSKGEDGEKTLHHLTLLAQNLEGYRNLSRLSSAGFLEGFYYKPRIDHALLAEHTAGVIALSGCISAEVPQLILAGRESEAWTRMEWFARTFPGRYFVEVQRHGDPHSTRPEEAELARLQLHVNAFLKDAAQELGLPVVATNDGHYVQRQDATTHDVLLAVQTGKTLDDPQRFKFACDEFYVKTPAELMEHLPVSEWGEEIYDNTGVVADLCEDEYLPLGRKRVYQMPEIPTPAGVSAGAHLRQLTLQGVQDRYPAVTDDALREYARGAYLALGRAAHAVLDQCGDPKLTTRAALHRFLALAGEACEQRAKAAHEKYATYPGLERLPDGEARRVLSRMEYELGVINGMGFPDYFLIVADYVTWAKARGIGVGPGRGSGAGSLVAYALRITDLDPLAFGLLFERFLNPERVSMPDFDVDFDDVRRGEVVRYLWETYGEDKVAQIANHNELGAKMAFKDAARVMGVSAADANTLTKLFPDHLSLAEAGEMREVKRRLDAHPALRRAFDAAVPLEGITRGIGVHASGVVIGRDALVNLVPLMRDTKGGGVVCQFDMKAVEDLGLVKMDILGLSTLSLLAEVLRLLRARGEHVDLSAIALDDPAPFDLLARGDTTGVFQLEGGGITGATKLMRPRTLNDIIALGALYRPGPMEHIPTYVRRLHGEEAVTYDGLEGVEAQLRPILDFTYGIPVYQEQVMRIASDIAGYSLGEADLLRRAMGKKDNVEMARQRGVFLDKCAARHVRAAEAERLFDLLARFANYGFNQSHSAAYGLITYQTAYLKAKYPVEFTAALLTLHAGDPKRMPKYVADARLRRVPLLPPSVNDSGANFTPQPQGVRFGLTALRGVSEETALRILSERDRAGPFRGLMDFCARFDSKVRSRRVLEALIKAGTMDTFGPRESLLASVDGVLNLLDKRDRQRKKRGELSGTLLLDDPLDEPPLVDAPPVSAAERLAWEVQMLGLYLSGHPLDAAPRLAGAASVHLVDLDGLLAQSGRSKVVLAGVLEKFEKKTTKAKEDWGVLTFSDPTGAVEALAFSRVYARVAPKLITGVPMVLVGTVDEDKGAARLVVDLLLLEPDLPGGPLTPELILSGMRAKTIEAQRSGWRTKSKSRGKE